MYVLKISGQNFVEEVEGSAEWSRKITRDFNDRLFRTVGEYKFIGHEGLYNILYNQLSINGVCEALTGRVYFDGEYEWRGEILPQDFEFDLVRKSADGQLLDNAWASKFNNAQDQKVFLRSDKSLNDVFIEVCPSRPCSFFDVDTGAYDFTGRRCFKISDVLDFLVKYYSDDTVTFASDYFDGGDGDQYFITTGEEIRQGEDKANPEVSFSEVFDELNKKFNLWIIIQGTLDSPILRIEPKSYLFTTKRLVDIVDPEQIRMTTDLDQLYTVVDVGSSATAYDIDNNAEYPDVQFETWKNESYNTAGACQFENNTLNLVSTWKIDTNTFQQILADDDSHDNSIVLVEIDPASDNAFQYTTAFTNGDGPSYIYNFNLRNESVVTNWFDGLPQELVKVLTKEFKCRVNIISPVVVSSPLVLPDDFAYGEIDYDDDSTPPNYDPDDIYTTAAEASGDDSAGEFKAPVGGYYRFVGNAVITSPPVTKTVGMAIAVYADNTRARRLAWYRAQRVTVTTGGFGIANIDETIYMNADEVAVVYAYEFRQVLSANNGYTVLASTISLLSIPPEYNSVPTDPLIYNYDIGRHACSRSDFDAMDQGLGFVRIIDTNGGKAYDVYAKEVTYNSLTGTIESGQFIGGRPPVDLCWILADGAWNDDCYWLDSEYWNG